MTYSSSRLLAASIILIIVNPILTIITAMIAFAVGAIAPGMESLSWFTLLGVPFFLIFISLLVGILGICSWKKPQKTIRCFFAGIILLICNLTYFVLLAITQEWTMGSSLFFFFIHSVIPVFYTGVSYQYKQNLHQSPTSAP